MSKPIWPTVQRWTLTGLVFCEVDWRFTRLVEINQLLLILDSTHLLFSFIYDIHYRDRNKHIWFTGTIASTVSQNSSFKFARMKYLAPWRWAGRANIWRRIGWPCCLMPLREHVVREEKVGQGEYIPQSSLGTCHTRFKTEYWNPCSNFLHDLNRLGQLTRSFLRASTLKKSICICVVGKVGSGNFHRFILQVCP
jgi:hypothetical protein